jgi:predicted SnoaL-like aldol condensation-catalyzing enzyme
MTTSPETTNANEDLVRRLWHTIWITGEVETLDQLVADPYVRHTRDGTVATSPVAYAKHLAGVVRTVRGTDVTIAHIGSVDDMVYARVHLDGVNLDTGNRLNLTWLTQYRIADGRIAEAWTMHLSDLDW